MTSLKKWMGCASSFVAGVLGLLLSLCSGMVITSKLEALNKTVQASEVITDSSLGLQAQKLGIASEFGFLKAMAIIMLIVSIALVIYSVVLLLKNLNVIKSECRVLEVISTVLFGLLLAVSIMLMIATSVYAGALATTLSTLYAPLTVTASMGAYQPLMLVISIVVLVVNCVFAYLKRKDA